MQQAHKNQKDGDQNAVAPQATNESIEITFSHFLFEMHSEHDAIRKDLLLPTEAEREEILRLEHEDQLKFAEAARQEEIANMTVSQMRDALEY